MQNIEFKAELRDPVAAEATCRVLNARFEGLLDQLDTYFKLPEGRLKRRETPGRPHEWIFYHRPDRVSPRMSHYSILSDAEASRRWGTAGLREWVRVRKRRRLWRLDNVRIHLDEVDTLGHFLEFEAVIDNKHDVQACHDAITRLRKEFALALGEPVACGYVDLIVQVGQGAGP